MSLGLLRPFGAPPFVADDMFDIVDLWLCLAAPIVFGITSEDDVPEPVPAEDCLCAIGAASDGSTLCPPPEDRRSGAGDSPDVAPSGGVSASLRNN